MPIRILPPEIAEKIAAGEVVERPASVVKELVENSLDAGATDIRVEISEGGRRLIRVADNGHGIPEDEVELAFARHATSKLVTADDLQRIRTLGFRGEALASIAAVSIVTMVTRHKDEAAGTAIRLEDGVVISKERRGMSPGTIITVEHLFHNVPARLKFLRQPATEAAHVHAIVGRYALAFPERRFSLAHGDRVLLQTTGSGDVLEVLSRVYDHETAAQMIPLPSGERQGVRVSGFISQPSLTRSNRTYLTLFLNRRWIHDNGINQAIIQGYHTLLPQGRYPLAVVFLEMPPEWVDVNVHPTKTEVRFADGRRVFRAVMEAVRQALSEHASVPGFEPRAEPTSWPGWAERRQALISAGRPDVGEDQMSLPLPRPEPSSVTLRPAPSPPPAQKREALPLLRVVGQIGASYIVAEGPDGMYLIDQHAAHERILYEQLMEQRERGEIPVQALLEPLSITLPPVLAAAASEALDDLRKLGFDLEPFGQNAFLLRSVPAILSEHEPRRALEDVLESLESERHSVAQAQEEALIRVVCKRAAIKAGQALSMAEMQEMIRQLEACRSPRTCPHGRPTMIHISAEQLARGFGRR